MMYWERDAHRELINPFIYGKAYQAERKAIEHPNDIEFPPSDWASLVDGETNMTWEVDGEEVDVRVLSLQSHFTITDADVDRAWERLKETWREPERRPARIFGKDAVNHFREELEKETGFTKHGKNETAQRRARRMLFCATMAVTHYQEGFKQTSSEGLTEDLRNRAGELWKRRKAVQKAAAKLYQELPAFIESLYTIAPDVYRRFPARDPIDKTEHLAFWPDGSLAIMGERDQFLFDVYHLMGENERYRSNWFFQRSHELEAFRSGELQRLATMSDTPDKRKIPSPRKRSNPSKAKGLRAFLAIRACLLFDVMHLHSEGTDIAPYRQAFVLAVLNVADGEDRGQKEEVVMDAFKAAGI